MISTEDKLLTQLHFVLNSIPFAILLEDKYRCLQFVNQNFCRLFSIPAQPEQMVGADCAEAAQAVACMFKDPQLFLTNIQKVVGELKPVYKELVELADGRLYLRDYLPLFQNDQLEGHLWLYYDYTDSHQMEHQMAHLKQFYEKILHNVPADIVAFDKEHRYLFVNQNGIANPSVRDWLIGKDDFDYIKFRGKDIQIAETRRAFFNSVLAEKQPKEFVEEIEDKQQHKRYVLRRMQPILDDHNDIDLVVGYGIDITSIKNAERLLRQKEKNIAQVADLLSVVVIVIDEDYNVVFTNPAYESLFGYPPQEVIGQKLNSLAIDNLDFIIKDFELYKNTRYVDSAQKVYQFKDKYGFTKHVTYSFTPYVSTDVNELNFAVFFNDVSDQYFAVSELQKIIEKERRLNELKSGFVNIVSHELRTPLSVIQSSAEIMEMLNDANQISQEHIRLHTNRIVNEVHGMHNLMEELLLVSKIESGKIEFRPYPQDLVNFVEVLLHERYSPFADGRTITLEIKGKPRLIEFDRMMMNHILNNLISNAFKYSNGKKTPRLRLRFTERSVCIIIADYGIGIPAKDRQKLFKAFARASNTDGIKGTGLGLLVAKYFIDFHKAPMRLKSKLNKGTCMVLELTEKRPANAHHSIDRR